MSVVQYVVSKSYGVFSKLLNIVMRIKKKKLTCHSRYYRSRQGIYITTIITTPVSWFPGPFCATLGQPCTKYKWQGRLYSHDNLLRLASIKPTVVQRLISIGSVSSRLIKIQITSIIQNLFTNHQGGLHAYPVLVV